MPLALFGAFLHLLPSAPLWWVSIGSQSPGQCHKWSYHCWLQRRSFYFKQESISANLPFGLGKLCSWMGTCSSKTVSQANPRRNEQDRQNALLTWKGSLSWNDNNCKEAESWKGRCMSHGSPLTRASAEVSTFVSDKSTRRKKGCTWWPLVKLGALTLCYIERCTEALIHVQNTSSGQVFAFNFHLFDSCNVVNLPLFLFAEKIASPLGSSFSLWAPCKTCQATPLDKTNLDISQRCHWNLPATFVCMAIPFLVLQKFTVCVFVYMRQWRQIQNRSLHGDMFCQYGPSQGGRRGRKKLRRWWKGEPVFYQHQQ